MARANKIESVQDKVNTFAGSGSDGDPLALPPDDCGVCHMRSATMLHPTQTEIITCDEHGSHVSLLLVCKQCH